MSFVIEKDPRLNRIYRQVTLETTENISLKLEEIGLTKPVSENNWLPRYPLTENGFYLINHAVIVGLGIIFENSRINLSPFEKLDETDLVNSLVKQSGLPQIRTQEEINEIDINFNGQQPLIKKIVSFLNPQKNNATCIKKVELNPIILVIESPNRVN